MKIVKEYLNEDEKVLKSRLLEFNKIKKLTPADLNIGVAQMIFDKTSGSWGDGKCAYSYDIYGSENWKEIIVWLINQGYTPHETEEVLRSKLMRWAGDDASKNENEKVNLDDFLKFNLQLFKGQTQVDYFLDEYNIRDKRVDEDMGEVCSPMSTLSNTPGMGNAVPASQATGGIGSGDNWGTNIKTYTQGGKIKKKKRKKRAVDEENINPFDKLGTAMAKKLRVPMVFKKGKNQTIRQKTFEHNIKTLDDYMKVNENDDKNKKLI